MSADWSPQTLFIGLAGLISVAAFQPMAAGAGLGARLVESSHSGASNPLSSFNGSCEGDDDGSALWIHGERVILRPGVELTDAAILVQDGVIVALGEDLQPPEGARQLEGRVVCAGFVDAWSSLGLDPRSASDLGTTASTRSADGLDPYRSPYLRAEALAAGVTSARLQGGGRAAMGGLGIVASTDPSYAPNVLLEDACVSATVGVARSGSGLDVFDRVAEVGRLVTWLKKGQGYGRDQQEYDHDLAEWETAIAESREELEDDFKKAKKSRDKEIEKAKEKDKEFKEEKFKEDKKPKKPRFDANDEVLARVAEGEVPLVVEAHRGPELRGLLEKTSEFGRLRLILAGASEASPFAEQLVERGIPVLLQLDPNRLGRGDYASYELSLPGELADAGVEVLLGSGGGAYARDLRLLAALAVGYGLDPEDALHAITLGPARAFDVADQVGSLERGKIADVLVFDGDPLDTQSRLQFVVTRGRVAGE